MKTEIQDYDNFTVVQLQGEFDGDFTETFQNIITEAVKEQKNGIILNMNKVKFIDSEGLERLLWAKDYCIENDYFIKFAGLDENCRKILEMTRLENEFDCYSELDQAVKSFT